MKSFLRNREEKNIFLVALLAHFLLFFLFAYLKGISIFWDGPQDVRAYTHLAQNILRFGSYISLNDITPESWYTPGYPVFLAVLYAIFHSWIPVVILQNIIAAFTAVIIYRIGSEYGSPRTGYIAGLLFALEPTSATLPNFLWSETVFVFLLVISSYYFLRFVSSPNASTAMILGFLLAIATYVRQASFFLPILMLLSIGSIYIFLKTPAWKKIFTMTILVLCITYLILTPWLVRNYIIYGRASIGGAGSMMLYFYDAVPFAYYKNSSSKIAHLFDRETVATPAWDIPYRSFPPDMHYTAGAGLQHEKEILAAAKHIIMRAPVEYIFFHSITGFSGMVLKSGWTDILRRLDISPTSTPLLWYGTAGAGILFYICVTFLASIGAIRLLRRDVRALLLAIMSILLIAYFIAVTGPASYRERYRYPVQPYLFILAASGILAVTESKRFVRHTNNIKKNTKN